MWMWLCGGGGAGGLMSRGTHWYGQTRKRISRIWWQIREWKGRKEKKVQAATIWLSASQQWGVGWQTHRHGQSGDLGLQRPQNRQEPNGQSAQHRSWAVAGAQQLYIERMILNASWSILFFDSFDMLGAFYVLRDNRTKGLSFMHYLVSQMRKLSLREVQWLSQGHKAGKR